MKRISVVGSSGSGKTTVARRLADALSAPHVELDALHWGADWNAATTEQLAALVSAATAGDRWVVDGNYWSKIGPQVWMSADTVVWVSPPRWRTTWQSVTRTVRRAVTREELWAGNRESWRGLMFWRGEESILWWAWTTYERTQERYQAAMDDPQWQHLDFHRLQTRREVDRFIEEVKAARGDRPRPAWPSRQGETELARRRSAATVAGGGRTPSAPSATVPSRGPRPGDLLLEFDPGRACGPADSAVRRGVGRGGYWSGGSTGSTTWRQAGPVGPPGGVASRVPVWSTTRW